MLVDVVDVIDVVEMVDIIAFALILLLGLCLALAARKIARDLYDRYQARHAPPPPMLDLNRLEDLRNILRSNENAPGVEPSPGASAGAGLNTLRLRRRPTPRRGKARAL
jgi:hypothetical protein